MAKPIKGPIWELRHRSGIRLYYWRERDRADQGLIEYALRAYEEWRRP